MRHNVEIDRYYNNSYIHKPIMWREIVASIENSSKKGTGVVVDCTLGEGGHSEVFLKHFENIQVIAFERDPQILERARKRLSVYGVRFRCINDNFSTIGEHLAEERVDYILYDFGISSFHLDASGRGFSFAGDEPLAMNLDGSGMTAEDVVNSYSETDLRRIIKEFGEERWFPKIAKAIVDRRAEAPIKTTGELAEIVLRAIPRKFHVKNIHPATRVFQAIRIEVNGELAAIQDGLLGGFNVLAEDGIMMAMSFHSLEDRIAKRFFKRLKDGCLCGLDGKYCVCTGKPFGEILTRKPVMAHEDEVIWNSRSRSAKLRVLKKLRDLDGKFK